MTVKTLILTPTLNPFICVTEKEIWIIIGCLVVASFNCGIGNVWKAIERSGQPSPTFWDMKNLLPEETRDYLMNFQL